MSREKSPKVDAEDTPLLNSGVKTQPQTDEEHGYFTYGGDSIKTIVGKSDNGDDDPAREKSGLKIFSSLSGRRKYALILVTLATFWGGVAHSLLPPFYTTEAVKKGVGIAVVGVVYGVSQVVVFLTAPLFGNYMMILEPKFVFLSGIFLKGFCYILLGTLEYCPSGTPFVIMSLLIRSVEAVGLSGFLTSSFAIMSSEFKDYIALTFGIVQTGYGLGLILGPTIGGVLFEYGGFGIPFYFAGVCNLINGLAVYKFLPVVEEVPSGRRGSMLTLLRSPMVVVPMCSVFVGVAGINTYESTFAQHLVPMDFSVEAVGILFSILAGIYTLMSTIWGYLSDSRDIQAPLIVVGHFVFGFGFLLLGPSILLPSVTFNLAIVLIGLACIGVSYGCAFIPTLKCMVVGATELGFENNTATFALVSGLFNSVQTLGGFVGPVGVGFLVQRFDYPVAYTVVGMCSFLMMFVSLVFFTNRSLDPPPNSHWKRGDILVSSYNDDVYVGIPFSERQFSSVSATVPWSDHLKSKSLRQSLRLSRAYGGELI